MNVVIIDEVIENTVYSKVTFEIAIIATMGEKGKSVTYNLRMNVQRSGNERRKRLISELAKRW